MTQPEVMESEYSSFQLYCRSSPRSSRMIFALRHSSPVTLGIGSVFSPVLTKTWISRLLRTTLSAAGVCSTI